MSFAIIIAFRPNLIFGGIAQLGERLNGIQEVSGSIPLISTKRKALKLNGFGAFKFFSYTDAPHFGLYSVLAAFKMPFP